MATYVIGDVQGCFEPLQTLLTLIAFNENKDRLWFTGDLVNRGPHSLETLRFVRSLGDSAITVLGNHDLMLLAVHYAHLALPHNCNEMLDAQDRDELFKWFATRPLCYFDASHPVLLVHAGILPAWDLNTTLTLAREAEQYLHGPHVVDFFQHMYGDDPLTWEPSLTGWDRIRFIVNVFSRIRFCCNNTVELKTKLGLDHAPFGYKPWFVQLDPSFKHIHVVFGHWATLHPSDCTIPRVYPLDTGCVWGNALTALRLEDKRRFSVPCHGSCTP